MGNCGIKLNSQTAVLGGSFGANLSTINPTWTGLKSHPNLLGERACTNLLSYGKTGVTFR
jgi:hypothetical protein